MNDKKNPPPSQKELRNARLRQALRDNLKKRKAQARGRAQDTENTAENVAADGGPNPPDSPAKQGREAR
jgi:hypothetical protein